jgi:hypothetical protein
MFGTGQTRRISILEAAVNTTIGWSLSFLLNMLILPHFGYDIKVRDAAAMGAVLTVFSLMRTYLVRRWFNAKLVKQKRLLQEQKEEARRAMWTHVC